MAKADDQALDLDLEDACAKFSQSAIDHVNAVMHLRRISVVELAKTLGTTKSELAKVLEGKTRLTLYRMIELGRALEITWELGWKLAK